MIVDHRAQFDFFDFNHALLLAGFGKALLFLEFEFSVIENFGDRRLGIWRNLNEIKPSFLGHNHGLPGWHDANIVAVSINQAHVSAFDAVVDFVGFFLGRRFKWRTTGRARPLWRHGAWWKDQVAEIS